LSVQAVLLLRCGGSDKREKGFFLDHGSAMCSGVYMHLANSYCLVSAADKFIDEVSPTGKIPDNFKTYSLFLVCNPQWLAPEDNPSLTSLYLHFDSFGRTIGDDNLAVWFWKLPSFPSIPSDDNYLAEAVDVERCVRFCQGWKLKPSSGPHLVVTSTYPDESHLSSGLPANSAVFALGNMKPTEIEALLAKLTDELEEQGHVEKTPDASKASPEPQMIRLLEATQQIINSFGCAWTFKIEAGPVNADLHSCQTR
jgi:hypothetical protein